MALLDVTEVLIDPDFMDTGLVCTRNTQTVGPNGLAINTPTLFPFAGVVTNDNGDVLNRIAEGERNVADIVVHTTFVLTDGRGNVSTDLVSWRGEQYTVKSVIDYSHFGRGFVSASCKLIPIGG